MNRMVQRPMSESGDDLTSRQPAAAPEPMPSTSERPVAKAKISGLRKLSSRKIMESALVTLKGRSRVSRAMWNRRAQEYEAKINSGDPVSIAEVVRDLHRNAGQPDQSYSERQIYEAALDRLARELAAVERIDKDLATQKLNSVLQKVA